MTGSAFQRRRLWLASSLALTSAMALGGCATLGGNVRGDFSCAAPDGICAPSSTIDDRALAMISSEAMDGEILPAASTQRGSTTRANRASAPQAARVTTADPSRTREKVLRIVFQPYIDERGRLHEASAVRAVVASGEWQAAVGQTTPSDPHLAYDATSTETFAEAVDRVDPPGGALSATDPNLPDPAAVAAARARKPDPVEGIRADVASRLAPRAGSAPAPVTVDGVARPPSAAVSPVLPSPAGVPASGSAGTVQGAGKPESAISNAGTQAVERVKSAPAYRQVAGSIAQEARDAAAQSGAAPAAPAASAPTVRAADFPAGVQEDE